MTNLHGTHEQKRNFQLEIIESKSDFVYLHLKLPKDEFNNLREALANKHTMDALCAAATETGLADALKGSTYCTICHNNGVKHQHESKTWFNAFVESLIYCGPSFAMYDGKCQGGATIDHD